MAEDDPLLTAVETLTKPVIEHIAQKTDTGKWIKSHTTTLPPLLQQLHDRVWPSGGNDGNSKSVAHERSVADNTMLHEYSKIASEITSWAIRAGAKPTRDPIVDLQRWLVLRQAETDRDDDPWIRVLRGWEFAIRRMLDKPHAFSLTGACPVCGATEWGDWLNGGGMRVLKVEYVLDEHEHPVNVNALCQACRVVWEGREAVDELADELTGRDSG